MPTDVTYQKEFFVAIMPELPRLFQCHYDEAALDKDKMPLNPAWKRYVELEIAGILHILTVRADGKLAGYVFNMVYPHLHNPDITYSFSDMFYLADECRSRIPGTGLFAVPGIRMFVENDKMLKHMGVQNNIYAMRNIVDLAKVMKRLKYRFIGRIFSRWL